MLEPQVQEHAPDRQHGLLLAIDFSNMQELRRVSEIMVHF